MIFTQNSPSKLKLKFSRAALFENQQTMAETSILQHDVYHHAAYLLRFLAEIFLTLF